jgi:hypothetical protein
MGNADPKTRALVALHNMFVALDMSECLSNRDIGQPKDGGAHEWVADKIERVSREVCGRISYAHNKKYTH